jgi:hypothetical protein
MSNLEIVVGVLERNREARHWADLNVARDVLVALGLPESDPVGEPAPMTIAEAATPAPTDDAQAEPSATA